MNKQLLNILLCPVTHEPFDLIEIEREKEFVITNFEKIRVHTGVLISQKTKYAYPIIDGIPRIIRGAMLLYKRQLLQFADVIKKLEIYPGSYLLEEEFKKLYLPTLKTFEKEWTNHDLNGNTWGWNQNDRINKYCEYLNIKRKDYSNHLFLDIGAGSGQFTCTIANELNCKIIGVDLTLGILQGEKIRRSMNNGDHVFFIQANLMELPFKKGVFDFVHASGVIHHTPDTEKAFNAIEGFTKQAGTLGVWIYRKIEGKIPLLPIIPLVNYRKLIINEVFARRYSIKINPRLLYLLVYIYSAWFQLFYKLNALIRRKEHTQTIKERTTSLFDRLSPTYVNKHNPNEVIEWFKQKGYSNIIETDIENPNGFNVCGVKSRYKIY